MDPTLLSQYINAYQNSNVTPIAMTSGGANQGLTNFFNSPAAQQAYGSGPATQIAATGQYNPAVAFAMDPGVQLAIQAGQPMLADQYAAKGLGASGTAAAGLSQYMYNNYNNYVGTQSNLFNNYQNQLSNLAQFGSTQTGGAQANQNQQNLSSLLANIYSSQGNQLSNSYQNTGSNIAQLLGNQGVLGANIYSGTYAAEANNLLQGSLLGAQLAGQQNASNAQTASSALKGQGASNAYSQLSGTGGFY